MSSVPARDIDLLLIGKTGHGKSATGNSILGRYEFEESSDGESMTFGVSEAWSEMENFTVKVIDGPGVGDTRLTTLEDVQRACENMSEAMLKCSRGFHALLLVLKYGNRFTREEKESIKMLKQLFGENVIQDYCICIMTHGECFKQQQRRSRSNKTFMDWCREQDGDLGELLRECEYRSVLFHNLTEDPEVKATQVRELFQQVDGLRYRGVRYTNRHFDEAQKERERLVVGAKAPQLKEEISKQTSLLLEALNRVQEAKDDFEMAEQELARLAQKVQLLLQEIEKEDKGTHVLDSLKDTVTPIQNTIERHMVTVQMRKEGKLRDEERAREHQEMMNQLEEQRSKVQKVHNEGTRGSGVGYYIMESIKIICGTVLTAIRCFFRF